MAASDKEEETVYSHFVQLATDELEGMLNKIPEPRSLCFTQKYYSFLNRALNQQAISKFKHFFMLEKIPPTSQQLSLCAFCLDDPESVTDTCQLLQAQTAHRKYLFMMPRCSPISKAIIDRSGLIQDPIGFAFYELHLEIMPLESDFFLIPSPQAFRRCFVENDISDVYTIAHSLLKLQLLAGAPTRTFVAGSISTRVNKLLKDLKSQVGSSYFNAERQFDELFIIDRTADLFTPLFSQASYSGRLEESYNVDYGYLTIPKNIDATCAPDGKYLLSDTDEYYKEMRSMNISDAFQYINALNMETQQITEKLKSDEIKNQISEWSSLFRRAQKLSKTLDEITLHWNLNEDLINTNHMYHPMFYYEFEQIHEYDHDAKVIYNLLNNGDFLDGLRLFCLESLIKRGVKDKQYLEIQKRFINQFGYSITKSFLGLERVGLISQSKSIFNLDKQTKPKFKQINEVFKLLTDMPSEGGNNDETNTDQKLARLYDGYIPLLVRLVQSGLNSDWAQDSKENIILSQMGVEHSVEGRASPQRQDANGPIPKRILVFVVGGVTQTELSLFRLLGSEVYKKSINFHVGSTGIVTGCKLLQNICPDIQNLELFK